MRHQKLFRAIALLVLIFALEIPHLSNAQTQTPPAVLTVMKPVSGKIDDTTPEQDWTFDAISGQRMSARMQVTSGNLAPALDMVDQSGKLLISGNSATLGSVLIDAFTIPATGTYTLRCGHAQTDTPTSGTYALLLLPGYSFLLLKDSADGSTAFRSWSEAHSSAHPTDGKIHLQMALPGQLAWTTANKLGVFKDLYMQAEVQPERTSGYWEIGLLFRGVTFNNVLQFYVMFVNSDGKWKFALSKPDGLTTIHDWSPLPSPITDKATLGVLANADQFVFYYNGNLIADLSDDTLSDPGVFGLVVGTNKAPGSYTNAAFDNILVTLPNNRATNAAIVAPQTLTQWQRAPELILGELRDANLISSAGKVGVKLNDAFSRNSLPGGIVFVPLAHSNSFTDLVYTSDITWESNSDNIACALEFRATDANNFSIVYIDRKGGYGIRQIDAGNPILSYYDLSAIIHKENDATNRLTILAIGNRLIVYLNGSLVGNMIVKQATGGVSIAAYNYQPASTRCQFTNLWLQTFYP